MTGLRISPGLFYVLLPILTGITTFVFICIFMRNLFADKTKIKNRISKLVSGAPLTSAAIKTSKKKKKTDKVKVSKLEVISEELLSADILMRPEEFINIWILLIFVPSGLVALISGNMPLSVALVILGAVAPPMYVVKQKKKRLMVFEKQLGDALVVISNCLRSGLTFQQAMENISKEMEDPIAREFTRAIREIKYGSTVERALNNMVERIKSSDLMLTVSAILIQRQIGGNLSEILDNISGTIKERIKLKDEIRVLTATGRMSGTVVGILPVAIGLILLLTNPGYIMMFFETDIGIIMLVIAGMLEAIGFMIVRKIVSIKY